MEEIDASLTVDLPVLQIYQERGKVDLAEEELEKLMAASHVKYAIAEMSKTDKGDEADNVRFGELLYGRHFKVVFMGSALFALQQLSGINAVFYFSSIVLKKAGVPSNIANTCVGIINLTGNYNGPSSNSREFICTKLCSIIPISWWDPTSRRIMDTKQKF